MVRRLVLGCSAAGSTLVEQRATADEDLLVVTDDKSWVSTLRDRGVTAIDADPTDSTVYPDDAAVVVIASDDPARNVAAAAAAHSRYPKAMLIAHVGDAPTADQRAQLESIADRVIDPASAMTSRICHAVGLDMPPADHERLPRLFRTIRSLAGPLLIVAHDNPDPDAIASALGLARITEAAGGTPEVCYGGEIAHQENRAMMNLLDLSLCAFDTLDLDSYAGVALVDHSRPGINDSLPSETPIDIVIDHHPPRGAVDGTFVDVRPSAGSTSTLIVEYLSRLGIEPDRTLSTALLYGLRVDTRDFTRQVSSLDFEAASSLSSRVDESTLDRVESPSVTAETLRVFATAIDNRDVRGSTLASCVGEIRDRDALSQAADRLLDLDGIDVTFVYGYLDGVVHGSARARGTDLDIGELLRDALGQVGSAGGHEDMAGMQVPLGILAAVSDDAELATIVEEFIAERFFEALSDPPTAGPTATLSERDADYAG